MRMFCNQCGRQHEKRECIVGEDVEIHPTVEINVSEKLIIGDRTKILANAKIEGRSVVIGRECFIHEYSWLGGGRCFEKNADLVVGDWLHLGRFGHINYSDSVKIGSEVGIGHQSSVWTHGGYLAIDQDFPHVVAPVTIGDRVWLPNVWVNPGVNIGNDVVVAAMSLVNKDIPNDSFAAGIPAKFRPHKQNKQEAFHYIINWLLKHGIKIKSYDSNQIIKINGTEFHIKYRMIIGEVTNTSEKAKDLLRRIGIRFPYKAENGVYTPWNK